MLNQAPIIVSQHNLHIATNSRHIKRLGFGVGKLPTTVETTTRNGTQESATALSRIEEDMLDSVYGSTAEEEAAAQVRKFHFRAGHKQTEQNAAEDLTAQEVTRERKHRAHMVKLGGSPAAAKAGAAPAPVPAAAPAAAPGQAEEEGESHSMFNMDEDQGAPDQGFSGDIVEHDNMKTMTKDWRGEYGLGSGHHSYVKICAMYPDNQWCHDRGYHRTTPRPKSAAVRPMGGAIWALVLAASCRYTLA
jgi:hypothetical protein